VTAVTNGILTDMIRRQGEPFRWEGVDVHPYKETGTHFKNITRQTLFPGGDDIGTELRYFEIMPGGHSTLERHDHSHLVMIVRGRGAVLVGETVSEIGERDVVRIPPQTWHQFRPAEGESLGFLCIVACERDRPQLPTEEDLKALRQSPEVAAHIRV
jgi:mannose-6-phosphate isomerase-like protein (cupin superfamily)